MFNNLKVISVTFFLFIGLIFNTLAQNETLFEYGPHRVTKSEFVNVYTKNNVTSNGDFSEESVRDYLDLYIKFKLKVQQAKDMNLDTMKAIQDEFSTYRNQLAKSYLIDRQITDQILKETYDRLQKEVHAKHILVKTPENVSKEEQNQALSKAKKIKARIEAGEDFSKVAKEVSDDPSAVNNGGDLGYFTALQMVYPFESAAYNTPVGSVSDPVKTRFGYHLVMVEDVRPARGKMQAAHIFVNISENADKEQQEAAEEKINKAYEKLEDGLPFATVVKQYSEDRATVSKGGELPWFETGKMVPEFEDAAFSLKEDGAYSKPFKTKYGWHIVQRLKKQEPQSFEDMKAGLKRKVEKDSRSEITKKEYLEKLKKEYSFKEYPKSLEKLKAQIDESILKGEWKIENPKKLKKPLFILSDKKYTQNDFAQYIEKKQSKRATTGKTTNEIVDQLYTAYVEQTISDFEESRLEVKYPEFKTLMEEYRDGILLFELIDRNVWSKAVKDTVGLRNFFDKHRDAFVWKERAEATVFTCTDKDDCAKVSKMLKKGKTTDQVLDELNGVGDKRKETVTATTDTYEKEENATVDKAEWKKGIVSNVIVNDDKTYSVVKTINVMEPTYKTLNEARGYVISDYQDELEQQWITSLRQKYPVTIHEEVLQSIIK